MVIFKIISLFRTTMLKCVKYCANWLDVTAKKSNPCTIAFGSRVARWSEQLLWQGARQRRALKSGDPARHRSVGLPIQDASTWKKWLSEVLRRPIYSLDTLYSAYPDNTKQPRRGDPSLPRFDRRHHLDPVSQKGQWILSYNFGKCWPLFIILSRFSMHSSRTSAILLYQ